MEPGTEDETELEAWLTEEGERTRLVVEERGLPLDKINFYGAGWQAHLEDLRRSLAGETSAWKSRWTELTRPTRRCRSAADTPIRCHAPAHASV